MLPNPIPVGTLAWWRVRDPLLTATEPQRLPVVVLRQSSPKRVRVEVVHDSRGVRDPDRLPGQRFTVTIAKLYEREPSP